MLSSISLKNVRVFRGEWHFDLKPLTVVCGTNSSGKSTLLKAPLLLQQSAESVLEGSINGSLNLAGGIVDVGRYSTLVSDHDETAEIGLGIEIQDQMATRKLRELRGGRRVTTPVKRIRLSPYKLSAWFGFNDARSMREYSGIHGRLTAGIPALTNAKFVLSSEGDKLLEWTVERSRRGDSPEDDEFTLTMPRRYERRVTAGRQPSAGRTNGESVTFGTVLLGILPFLLIGRRTGRADGERSTFPFPLPPHMSEAMTDLKLHLDSLRYVGPLRAPARRYYSAQTSHVSALDTTGERIPFILRDQLRHVVSFRPPGKATRPRRAALRIACNQWLHYLRTGEVSLDRDPDLAISSLRDVMVELKLRSTASSGLHAMVDSGFGYSQVLPILVSCLLLPPSRTIIIEQPELHLNPALQVRLAEFFVAVAGSGRQVVIETHSEHIVNALRVLVAEDASGELADLIGITYLNDEAGAVSKLDLSINADGTVPDWPPSFFGEALTLTTRLLAAQRSHLPGSPS